MENSESNLGTDEANAKLPLFTSASEVKDMIKKIVKKCVLPKLPGLTYIENTRSYLIFEKKQKDFVNEIWKMSKSLPKRFNKTEGKGSKSKHKKKKMTQLEESPKRATNLNSSDEWQRQKIQNLKYFNIKPETNGDKTKSEEIKQHTNKTSTNTDKYHENYNQKDKNNMYISNELKRKLSETNLDNLNKCSRIESKENTKTIHTTTIKHEKIIDLSNDDKVEEISNNSKKPKINKKLIGNTIEINGECGNEATEDN